MTICLVLFQMTAEVLLHLLTSGVGQQFIVDGHRHHQLISAISRPSDDVPFVISIVDRAIIRWPDGLQIRPRAIMEFDLLLLQRVLVDVVFMVEQGKLQIIIDGRREQPPHLITEQRDADMLDGTIV